jgi:hypothetical protein
MADETPRGPAPCIRPQNGPKSGYFPNVVVTTHENRRALFYDDLLRGKRVLINFMSTQGEPDTHITENLARVQAHLGDRLGRDIFMYSITTDPVHDRPAVLEAFAARHQVRPGWLLLTGEPSAIEMLRDRLFAGGTPHVHDSSHEDCSLGMVRYGNEAVGLWGTAPASADPEWIARRISWVESRPAPSGEFKRRGPAPLVSALLVAAALVPLGAQRSQGQQPAAPGPYYPHNQPHLSPSVVTVSADGLTTTVTTGPSVFPPCNPIAQCNPWLYPPGLNLLPTVYTNIYDGKGVEMPNTLPSTPTIPYNLHDGDPQISIINQSGNPTNTPSPQDDLRFVVFNTILTNAEALQKEGLSPDNAAQKVRSIQTAITYGINILEGNPIANRAYSGLPLLHYKAGEKVKIVDPKTRNVDIHQVWYDTHIESDTAYLDVRGVKDVPWTVTYTVDVLNRGHDDFSPYVMYFDDPSLSPPGMMPMPYVGMDQSFFNMEDGTRTRLKIKMAPGKYFNLVYTWGWRAHPPRVQVTENACKTMPYKPPAPTDDCATTPNTMVNYERAIFFRNGKPDKEYAIGQLSRYAPAMRIRTALLAARDALGKKQYPPIIDLFRTELDAQGQPGMARQAWDDWRDRTRLPRGLPKSVMDVVSDDKESDLSLVYLNNTIYAHFTDGGRMDFPKWTVRGTWLKVALYNGDYFDHGYQNVDFGGGRGWENQFKSSVKVGGSGCWFTFGRNYWSMNIPPAAALMNNKIPGTVTVPAATRAATPGGDDQFGVHKVNILYNYEPSRRLRFYQFDPVHHDVAVFSVH